MKKHTDHSFLGTGWSFPPEFDPDMGSIVMVSDEQDIWESLQLILSTSPGERMMFPKFGCGIRRMVFDTVNTTFLTQLKDLIRFSVLHYEPRIVLNDVTISGSDTHEGMLHIKLDYTIRKTNSRSNLVYPFYLREGTNIAPQYIKSSKESK
ncbi:MAG: GPW/gp25 family protein [Bacteroidota bacterium]|nr:GPW/gp25 family protein [Bacteroidota bacterium]